MRRNMPTFFQADRGQLQKLSDPVSISLLRPAIHRPTSIHYLLIRTYTPHHGDATNPDCHGSLAGDMLSQNCRCPFPSIQMRHRHLEVLQSLCQRPVQRSLRSYLQCLHQLLGRPGREADLPSSHPSVQQQHEGKFI